MERQIRASNKMLVVGTTLIVASFTLVVFFLKFVPFNPSDRLTMWLSVLLIMALLELGFFSIIVVKIKEAVVAFLVIFVWSFIFLVPVPQGYEEPIYGGSWILVFALWILYDKYKKSRKKMLLEKENKMSCLTLKETEKWFLKCSKAVAAICLISGLMGITIFGLSHPHLLFTPIPLFAFAITFLAFVIALIGAKKYETLFKALQITELLYQNKEKIYTTEMIEIELKTNVKKLNKALNLLQKENMVEIQGGNVQLTQLGKIIVENSRKGE